MLANFSTLSVRLSSEWGFSATCVWPSSLFSYSMADPENHSHWDIGPHQGCQSLRAQRSKFIQLYNLAQRKRVGEGVYKTYTPAQSIWMVAGQGKAGRSLYVSFESFIYSFSYLETVSHHGAKDGLNLKPLLTTLNFHFLTQLWILLVSSAPYTSIYSIRHLVYSNKKVNYKSLIVVPGMWISWESTYLAFMRPWLPILPTL